jgi:Flp pilus assembly pilin Flp
MKRRNLMLSFLKSLLRKEADQALIAYALPLVLLALAAIIVIPTLGAAAQGSAAQLSLALSWTAVVCPEAPETGNQPEVALRHTRSALIGSAALGYGVWVGLLVLLFSSEAVSTEVAVFAVGVLGFALGLTVAVAVVSQAIQRARHKGQGL